MHFKIFCLKSLKKWLNKILTDKTNYSLIILKKNNHSTYTPRYICITACVSDFPERRYDHFYETRFQLVNLMWYFDSLTVVSPDGVK